MFGQALSFCEKNIPFRNINIEKTSLKEDQFLKYVSKNQTLKDIREYIEKTDDGKILLNELLVALKNKDGSASIFSNDYALMLTQLLFEKGQVSDMERLTVFQYLTILRTYTERQSLREEDSDLKVICDVELISSNNPKYKSYLYQYLGNIFSTLARGILRDRNSPDLIIVVDDSRRFAFSIDKVIDSMRTMRNFEDCMIVIHQPKNGQIQHPSYEPLLEFALTGLTNNSFYIEDERVIVLPSISVFELIQKQINPDFCFEQSPMLGWIKPETLFNNFHKNRSHPISIYSNHIKSNPPSVHSLRGGPAFTMLHDLFHTRMVSLIFSDKMYQFYTNQLIPFSIQFQKSFCRINGIEFNSLNSFVEFTNDYLLTKQNRFAEILKLCFNVISGLPMKDSHKKMACFFLIVAFENINQELLDCYDLNSFERPQDWQGGESSEALAKIKNNNIIAPHCLSEWDDNSMCNLLKTIKKVIKVKNNLSHNYLPSYGSINNIGESLSLMTNDANYANASKKRKGDSESNDERVYKKVKL